MAEGNYSLADIASITGNRGFGGDSGMFALLFLLIILGGGNWGGFGGNRGYATQNEMQQGFDNQNTMANQREILNAVTNGTTQSVAATNQSFHDTLGVITDKYGELTRDIAAVAVSQQQAMANQNQCCCNTLRAIDSVNFNAAQNTAAINAVTTAQTQKILDAMAQNKIDALQNRVAELQNQLNSVGTVKYPMSASYSIPVPNVWGNPPPPFPFV